MIIINISFSDIWCFRAFVAKNNFKEEAQK